MFRRSWRGLRGSFRPLLLPLSKLLGGGSLDVVSENEMDLIRSGDNQADVDVFEGFDFFVLRAGLAGGRLVMDADSVTLWVNAKAGQDITLQFFGPDSDGFTALVADQLDLMVIDNLDCHGLGAGKGA